MMPEKVLRQTVRGYIRLILSGSSLIFLVVLLLNAEVWSEEQQSSRDIFQSVSPLEALQLITERQADLIVVDVRTARERSRAAIENSIHIEMGDVFQGNHALRRNQPVLLYCAVGGRSYAAAKWLKMKGFGEVYNLDGGIDAWSKEGLKIIK